DHAEPQFGRFSSERQSCREFLRLNRSEFEVQGKNQVLIRYSLHLSAQLPPGTYYCAAGFTTAPLPWEEGSGLSVNVRVVASFYVNVGSPKLIGSVQQLEVEPQAQDQPERHRIICVVTNGGTYVWRPDGSLELLDASGVILESVPFRSLPVLPDRQQRF